MGLQFQRCLELRDKYIKISRQRLEDDPRNYDGEFNPAPDSTSTSTAHLDSQQSNTLPKFSKWNIYPPPPLPHWNTGDPFAPAPQGLILKNGYDPEEFVQADCKIPEKDSSRTFRLDSKSVFQVYDSAATPEASTPATPICRIPDLKEYFSDLEFMLGVVGDGPARSFAWRRLKYLESKWDMYVLLNEYQELADMKVKLSAVVNVRSILMTSLPLTASASVCWKIYTRTVADGSAQSRFL